MTQTVLLGDICQYVTEKIAVGEVALQDYVSTENLIADKKGLSLATNLPQVGKVTKYQTGDVLVSNIRPYFKKIWLANREGGASNDVLVFRPKTKEIANRYLFYILANDKFFDYSTASSSGSKMPRGDKAQIMKYPVHLPNLETQKKIADILGTIDEKIELNRQMNETLEQMGQALFRHYFIDDPEAELITLDSIMTLERGVEPGSKAYKNTASYDSVAFFRVGDLGSRSSGIYIDETLTKNKTVDYSDVLVSFDGAPGLVGYGFNGSYSSGLRKVIYMNDDLGSGYAYFLLSCKESQYTIDMHATGTTIKHASGAIPHMQAWRSDNKQYYRDINDVFDVMLSNTQQIQTLTTLRDTLLPRLISGKVKV